MWNIAFGLLAFFILIISDAHYAWYIGLLAWAWWVLTRDR